MFKIAAIALSASLFVGLANAHVSCYAPGMYCGLGNTGSPDLNSYAIVKPLFQLPFDQWWMHHVDNCDAFPPPEGEFLELPAGGSVEVDIVSNRAKSRMSYGGRDTSDWPDGANYPPDYHVDSCIISPNLHTQNEANAAGTAFAISYNSELSAVKPDNLVVFTVAPNTPFRRVATYQVPAALPACPPGGCICTWLWVPNGCGQPNMYMAPFKCKVTGATSTTPIGTPKPPVWCENNPDACVKGPKQAVFWNQAEGNNVVVDGLDASGQPKSPGYNMKMGFGPGAQNDIFSGAPSGGAPAAPASPAPVPASSPSPSPAPAPPAQQPNPNNGGGNTNDNNNNAPPAGGSPPLAAGSPPPPAGSSPPAVGTPPSAGSPPPAGGSSPPAAGSPSPNTGSGSAPSSGGSPAYDSGSSPATPPSVPAPSTTKKCRQRNKGGPNVKAKRSLVGGVASHNHRRQANHVF